MKPNAPIAWNDPADRIRAIAAGLAAAGLNVGTDGNRQTGLGVTAISQLPGRATAEIMLDEDGYAEIRWFTNPTAAAEDVTAAISYILAAVSAAPSVLAPTPPHECGMPLQALTPPHTLPPGTRAGLLQA